MCTQETRWLHNALNILIDSVGRYKCNKKQSIFQHSPSLKLHVQYVAVIYEFVDKGGGRMLFGIYEHNTFAN